MIFDSIKNKENYKEHKLIYQALSYLSALPEGEMPAPGTILVPDQLFCNPVSLTSKPKDQCIYEAHKKYADLHYILEGTEGIATADVETLRVSGGGSGRMLLSEARPVHGVLAKRRPQGRHHERKTAANPKNCM